MKIRLVGDELFYMERLTHRQTDGRTDGRIDKQTDMTKLTVASRKFAKAPKGGAFNFCLSRCSFERKRRKKQKNSHRMIHTQPTFIHMYKPTYI